MDLQPLVDAPFVVKLHLATVLPAAVLGTVQFALPKGTGAHRVFGYVYLALMLATALTAIFIQTGGGFSLIHLLVPLTLFGVVGGYVAIKAGRVASHRFAMVSLYIGAILNAGVFTLVPGRLLNGVFFGG